MSSNDHGRVTHVGRSAFSPRGLKTHCARGLKTQIPFHRLLKEGNLTWKTSWSSVPKQVKKKREEFRSLYIEVIVSRTLCKMFSGAGVQVEKVVLK